MSKDGIMFKQFSTTVMILFFGGCLNSCPSSPILPAPPEVIDADMCKPACDHLKELGCEEGEPVDTGEDCPPGMGCKDASCIEGVCMVTCERFCEETEKNGVWLNPTCVVNVASCDKIETCAPNG
jgi:hypothetical protein